jgi:CMP-2-keto-3-deoxyoctulosonic acid synthetase
LFFLLSPSEKLKIYTTLTHTNTALLFSRSPPPFHPWPLFLKEKKKTTFSVNLYTYKDSDYIAEVFKVQTSPLFDLMFKWAVLVPLAVGGFIFRDGTY